MKRLVKRPKWVFAGCGFGLHLQAIRDAHGLLNAPHFGHLFESAVVVPVVTRRLLEVTTVVGTGSWRRTPPYKKRKLIVIAFACRAKARSISPMLFAVPC